MIEKPIVIEGVADHYVVTDRGEFISTSHVDKSGFIRKAKKMKPAKDSQGYLGIGLLFNGVQKKFLAHRIVATHFLLNPDNKPMVNHKNGIKTDNRVENLEWVSRSENCVHSFAIGLQSNKGEKHPQRKLTNEMVLAIRSKRQQSYTTTEISKEYGISKTQVKDIIKRKSWGHI